MINLQYTLMSSILLILLHITLVTSFGRKLIKNASPMLNHIFSSMIIFVMLWVLNGIYSFDFWLAFSILLFSVSFYFFIFGALYKSLSLRFLLMTDSLGGRASLSTLDEMITHITFKERTDILCNMRLVSKKDHQYFLTPKGIKVINKIKCLRSFFGVQTTGLYDTSSETTL